MVNGKLARLDRGVRMEGIGTDHHREGALAERDARRPEERVCRHPRDRGAEHLRQDPDRSHLPQEVLLLAEEELRDLKPNLATLTIARRLAAAVPPSLAFTVLALVTVLVWQEGFHTPDRCIQRRGMSIQGNRHLLKPGANRLCKFMEKQPAGEEV